MFLFIRCWSPTRLRINPLRTMFLNKSILALLAIVLHISAVTSVAIKTLAGTGGGSSSANDDAALNAESTMLTKYLNELAAKHAKSEAAKTAKDKKYAADIQSVAAQSVIIGLSIGAPASSSSTTNAQGNVEAKAIINRASWNAAKGAGAKTKLVWNVVRLAMKNAMGKHKKGLNALAQVAEAAPPPDAPQSVSSGGAGGAGSATKPASGGSQGGSSAQNPPTGGK
ncbi:hypothetical protein BJ165DRAFT_1519761 [Panaeolus papilionaceus]|nr:hypothetical protein BJ165DRAFT_1519761 [Panaeolus papilionaceus]